MNSAIGAVIGFTARGKFRSKSFIVTSLVIALLLSVVIHLPYLIAKFQSHDELVKIGAIRGGAGGDIPAKLALMGASSVEPAGFSMAVYENQGSAEANESLLQQKLAEREIGGYLDFLPDPAVGFPSAVLKSESTDRGTVSRLQKALQSIKTEEITRNLLTPDQLSQIRTPVKLDAVQVSTIGGAGSVGEGKSEAQIKLATGLVYVLVIFLFMGVMITGQLIATEITAEKSSRVMEVLITSVSPLVQMFGKIIGMFLVAMSQIALLAVVAVINLGLPHNQQILRGMDINVSEIPPSLLVYAVLFYLAGFFLYATLFAAVGSIVSRTEELGQAVMPITFLSMAGFYIALFGLTSPNAAFIKAMSFVPFFTPFTMFLRIGLSDPPWWEVLLAFALLLAAILLLGWLAAKIYRTGVLMYGKRPTWKELRKAMKAYRV